MRIIICILRTIDNDYVPPRRYILNYKQLKRSVNGSLEDNNNIGDNCRRAQKHADVYRALHGCVIYVVK